MAHARTEWQPVYKNQATKERKCPYLAKNIRKHNENRKTNGYINCFQLPIADSYSDFTYNPEEYQGNYCYSNFRYSLTYLHLTSGLHPLIPDL